MKNTIKKVLAMVCAVVMICALMAPAMAATSEDKIKVTVRVLNKLDDFSKEETVTLSVSKATAKAALQSFTKASVSFNSTTGGVKKVDGYANNQLDLLDTDKWFVAINGKITNEALSSVAVNDGDVITLFYGDTTIGTTLVERDDSKIDQGIISFYYYDTNGNRQPLKNVKVAVKLNGEAVLNKFVPATAVTTSTYLVSNAAGTIKFTGMSTTATDANGWVVTDEYGFAVTGTYKADVTGVTSDSKNTFSAEFTTDELGQIWIDPSYLAQTQKNDLKFYVELTNVKATTKSDDTKTKNLFATKLNQKYYFEDAEAGYVLAEKGLYNVAGNTGDMTIAYVLVACAAIITLAAVVVMKKKVTVK